MLALCSSGVLSECSRHFMVMGFLSSFTAPSFLIVPLLLLGFPAALCLGASSTRVRGCQWCWGTMSGRWRNRAQAHHCCVCTPQHPPLPRWQPFTVWRIILWKLAFLMLINRANVIFSPFCFYHHPLSLFSSSIKLSPALILLSHG